MAFAVVEPYPWQYIQWKPPVRTAKRPDSEGTSAKNAASSAGEHSFASMRLLLDSELVPLYQSERNYTIWTFSRKYLYAWTSQDICRASQAVCGNLIVCSQCCHSIVTAFVKRCVLFVWRESFNVQTRLASRPRLCDRLNSACLRPFNHSHFNSRLRSQQGELRFLSSTNSALSCKVQSCMLFCPAEVRCRRVQENGDHNPCTRPK